MSVKIRNGLGGNCQWLASMFETNVIEANCILCRNFRSALYLNAAFSSISAPHD